MVVGLTNQLTENHEGALFERSFAYIKQKSLTGNQPVGSFIGDNRDRIPSSHLYLYYNMCLPYQQDAFFTQARKTFAAKQAADQSN